MSESNVEIVRRLLEGPSRGEYGEGLELYHPDIEFVMDGAFFPDPGTYTGIEAMARAFARWANTWEDRRMSDLELIDRGDRVVALYTTHSRGKASGLEVKDAVSAICTLRDGRVTKLVLTTREQGLREAGIEE